MQMPIPSHPIIVQIHRDLITLSWTRVCSLDYDFSSSHDPSPYLGHDSYPDRGSYPVVSPYPYHDFDFYLCAPVSHTDSGFEISPSGLYSYPFCDCDCENDSSVSASPPHLVCSLDPYPCPDHAQDLCHDPYSYPASEPDFCYRDVPMHQVHNDRY